MAKKMTLMSTLKCKTTNGKVIHYFVYHRGGGLRLLDPISSGTDVILRSRTPKTRK
jgi:hypothetical protein